MCYFRLMMAVFTSLRLCLILQVFLSTSLFAGALSTSKNTPATNLCLFLLAAQYPATDISTDADQIKEDMKEKISSNAGRRSSESERVSAELADISSALEVDEHVPLIQIRTNGLPNKTAAMAKQEEDLYWFFHNSSQPVFQPALFLLYGLAFTAIAGVMQANGADTRGVSLFATGAGLSWFTFLNRAMHYRRITPTAEAPINAMLPVSQSNESGALFSRAKISSPVWTLQPVLSPRNLADVASYLKTNLIDGLNEPIAYSRVEPFISALENFTGGRPVARPFYLRSAIFHQYVGANPEIEAYFWIEPESF